MSLTDAQWLAWLKQPDKQPTAAIQINYEDDGGTAGILYISNFGYIDPYDVDAPNYTASIVNDVILRQDEKLSVLESIDVKIDNASLFDYYFIGFSITVYYGDRSWAFSSFRQIYTGKIADFARLPNNYARILTDQNLLDVYLNQTVDISDYSYSSYANLDYPFGLGTGVFNMQPIRRSSTAYRMYWIEPFLSDLVVRKNGVTQTLTTHYTRSYYSGFTGVDISFVTAPGTNDVITIDLGGEYGSASGNFNIVGNSAARIVSNAIPHTFANVIRDSDVGYVWYEPEPFRKYAELCMRSCGAFPRMNASGEVEAYTPNTLPDTVTFRNVESPEIIQKSMQIVDISEVWKRYTFGWKKNFYPQRRGLDSSVSEANVRKFSQDYSYSLVTRTADEYPNAISVDAESIITDSNDMIAVQEFEFGYIGNGRTTIEYEVVYTGIYDDIGDSVKITTSDFGLSTGDYFTVIQNDINLNTGVCTQRGRT